MTSQQPPLTGKVLLLGPIECITSGPPPALCGALPPPVGAATAFFRVYPTTCKETMSTYTPALSYELFPPRSSASCESLLTTIDQLAPTNPDYVSVTYSGDRARKQKTLALLDHLVHETRLTPLAHLTCVGHTAEELEAAVRRILAIGVRGFLALRGDLPPGSTQAPDIPFARSLVDLIRRVETQDFAHLAAGRVAVGVAAYPSRHPESSSELQDIEILLSKERAGADFAITQVFFEATRYESLVQRARTAGVTLPLIPGIMPVTSLRRLTTLCSLAGLPVPQQLAYDLETASGDAQRHRIGVEFGVRLLQESLDAGAPGIHFYTFNEHAAVLDVLEQVDLPRYSTRFENPLAELTYA